MKIYIAKTNEVSYKILSQSKDDQINFLNGYLSHSITNQ